MSEPGPSSIPTSADRRSNNRPTKKRALNNTASTQQSAHLSALFANPDREISIPSTSTSLGKPLAAPPEIVTNVQGSSAGAGSGEFHVYKASRRREYERLRRMDEEVEREEADALFERQREEARKAEEEKLSKNRARREKMKVRKAKGKVGKDGVGDAEGEEGVENATAGVKRKLGLRKDLAEGAAKPASGAQESGDPNGENGASAAIEGGGGITIHDDD